MYLILKMIILTFSCGPQIWRGAWWNKSGKREDILTRDPTCSSCESIRRVVSSLGKGDLDHLGFKDLPVIPRTTYHPDLPCFTLYKISDRWLIEITRITNNDIIVKPSVGNHASRAFHLWRKVISTIAVSRIYQSYVGILTYIISLSFLSFFLLRNLICKEERNVSISLQQQSSLIEIT